MSTCGVRLTVYRNQESDYSNGGLSASADYLTVVGSVSPGTTKVIPLPPSLRTSPVTSNAPPVAVRILQAAVWNPDHKWAAVVPVVTDPESGEYVLASFDLGPGMFGGNYAGLGSSGLFDLIKDLIGYPFYGALAIHDRFESPRVRHS